MSSMKIIVLSFLGFTAILISIFVIFSLSLPTRPKYPVISEIPSTTSLSQSVEIPISNIETTPPDVVEPSQSQPIPISPPKPITSPATTTSIVRFASESEIAEAI